MTATGITGAPAIGIDEVTGLQAALDAKVDEPAVIADVTGLQAALDAKLPKAAPLVTDSTFTVTRTGGGAARWRSTGGALDIDTVGDVVESSFANQDFSGAQTGLRRMRAGSGNTLAGLTEFGSNVYAGEQSINAATGVANLGAKNSATNLGVAGYLDISTAPTTGTWAAGDVVLTRSGLMRCTAGGTPGTWLATGQFDAMPTPLDHGLAGWTFDPIEQQAGTVVPTAGLAHVVRIRALGPVVTNIHVHVTTAGSVLTANQCYMALYNDAGALLGAGAITASLHNTGTNGWGDTGAKVHPLATPQGVTPGAWYKVLFWYNGTTGPAISRNTNAGSAMLNIGLTASTARYATANSGLTTAGTVPANIGVTSGGSTAWWVGLS